MALNGPGGFPRAGGFKFSGGIPGGLHGLEEGSNVEEVDIFHFQSFGSLSSHPHKN